MKDIVNVRSSPGTDFPLIAQVKYGQKLPIVGEQDDWYQVSLPDGRTGWIARWLTAVVYSPQADPSNVTGKSVVIDPGHGMTHLWDGSDPGAIGPSGVVERDVVMKISLMLGDLLLKEGFTVIFTRHGDTSLTLSERANTACAANADLLVSVHANASTNPLLSRNDDLLLPFPGSRGRKLLIKKEAAGFCYSGRTARPSSERRQRCKRS
jgi:N-acetylmuramoyl-L-alanine amidase